MSSRIEQLRSKLIDRNPILMDGAMGTELQRRGVRTDLPLWSAGALDTSPEVIEKIHFDYIEAGAEIISTNTFRTNSRTFLKGALPDRSRELTLIACTLASAARTKSGRSNVIIAGSMAPLEDCYRPDLVDSKDKLDKEHQDTALNLAAGGVDIILVETMNCIREAQAALAAASTTGLPVAVSFVCDSTGNLLSGESLSDACLVAQEYNPLFIGTNCAPLDKIDNSLEALLTSTKTPIAVYANGDGQPDDAQGWKFNIEKGKDRYFQAAKAWAAKGALLIGGCCGTTPDYIGNLSRTFNR